MTGSVSFHAGVSAEDQVARHYARRGARAVARRWRGAGGEVDLVLLHADTVVFVEVKKSRDHARAAQRLSQRQIARLHAAASEYLATCPAGLNTPARFDVALVDRSGYIDIIENALCA
ncbi:MAG: YraN family protein [Pararhodobacter sp.]